tara:strand:+ start:323 stop:427 length:105 start_codon:yes stop_codon:yes gene_type:complete
MIKNSCYSLTDASVKKIKRRSISGRSRYANGNCI